MEDVNLLLDFKSKNAKLWSMNDFQNKNIITEIERLIIFNLVCR